MKRLIQLIVSSAKETPKLFFAPLVGAYKGIRNEYKALEQEAESKH